MSAARELTTNSARRRVTPRPLSAEAGGFAGSDASAQREWPAPAAMKEGTDKPAAWRRRRRGSRWEVVDIECLSWARASLRRGERAEILAAGLGDGGGDKVSAAVIAVGHDDHAEAVGWIDGQLRAGFDL